MNVISCSNPAIRMLIKTKNLAHKAERLALREKRVDLEMKIIKSTFSDALDVESADLFTIKNQRDDLLEKLRDNFFKNTLTGQLLKNSKLREFIEPLIL